MSIKKISIDFGNTNTIVGVLLENGTQQILHLPEIANIDEILSNTDDISSVSTIPTEVYYQEDKKIRIGGYVKKNSFKKKSINFFFILFRSKFKIKISEVLKKEGFIIDFNLENKENNKVDLVINLKYNSGAPVINTIERISKPGRRIFSSAESLPKINNGLGIAIISTSKGVMTDIDARKQKIGGEIICKVF